MSETNPSIGSPSDAPILRVSVILIAFNQAPALRRALEALERSQNRAEFEIVVVDCGSSDGSAGLDSHFPAVNMMRLPHHVGAVRAMNIATRTAKADLLFYLSPDVEVAPDTVKALADALEAESDTVAAVVPVFVDGSGQVIPKAFRLPDRAAVEAVAKGESLPTIPIAAGSEPVQVECASLDALMIRKSFIRSMNYFDQRYGHSWADVELAMQVQKASKKIRVLPGIPVTYHAAPDPLAGDSMKRLDRVDGAAEFLGKYRGGAFGFRLGMALGALAKFDFGGFAGILGGTKLDGGMK